MRLVSLLMIFILTSFGLSGQGWLTFLPDIPNTPSLIDRIGFTGFKVNQDSNYAMVTYEYGAASTRRDYVVIHGKDGQLLDYYSTPTIENKDLAIDAQFLFTSDHLAIHTFYTKWEQKEIVECVNLKTKNVLWSKKDLTLVDCVSDFQSTYSDIFCKSSTNGDYVFLDKNTGAVLNTFSADSMSNLIASFGQRDSVFEISRIAGNDSIQFFRGFVPKPNGDINLVHAKYEKSCACITDDFEFPRFQSIGFQSGFEQPLYTSYKLDHQVGDSTVNASIRMFNFDSDTIISEDIIIPATKGVDSTWTKPRVRLVRGFDGSFMIDSDILRDGLQNGRPELQGGKRFQFHNAAGDLIYVTEAFLLRAFDSRSVLAQNRGQSSFVLRPDSTATVAFRTSRTGFAVIGYVNFSKDEISPSKIETLEIFPNPFENQVSIKLENPSNLEGIAIYNINGQLIKEFKNPSPSFLPVEDLAAGIYCFVINLTDTAPISKVMLKK
ncbi:T9SS type A sorting domain-containing protein [Croceimicrobium hydrocarbonivorans]|uniref:T9SS type A sorting domain-containing protein n=1 Tax=Croceimicrobium hydrocarbonivorans TaxID=2761580 RepID=A0A7H0VD47_9FLAO|nr:T9SS type A sorting domain-containing protein [Croceimicrobium hydrocarbonivorans]QNR23645.1 T9SS type A sorting domain-containing protein [Croceimicrobium hydrocarbonivorans]